MICPNCGTDNRPGARFCAKCGASLISETVAWSPPTPAPDFSAAPSASPPISFSPPAAPVTVEKRYPVLRVLSVVYKVLGGIVAGLTVLGALAACIGGIAGGAMMGDFGQDLGLPIGGVVGGLVAGLVILLYGGIAAVTLFGAGEAVSAFLSIEENTRLTASMFQQRGP